MKAMYFIALILPEPLLSEANAVKHDLSKKYKTYASLKSPAHITLIPPFNFKEEDEYLLVRMMHDFCPGISPFSINLNGFGAFPPRVIFINPSHSSELLHLYQALQTHTKTVLPPRKKFSPPFHPHITVANRDWSEFDFQTAWDEMKSKPFSGEFSATEISLLRLEKEKWKILANFRIQ